MSKSRVPNRSRRAFLTSAGGLAAAVALPAARADAQSNPRLAPQPRDRALWVTWYDLPEAGRREHLAWVHEAYIPALRKRTEYLHAAHYESIPGARRPQTDDPTVPRGSAYILVVGAEDANVFGRLLPDELHATLSAEDRKMLAMRLGERTSIFAEASRITGPAAKGYRDGITLAPGIQFGTYNIDHRKEIDILAWYAQLAMPDLMSQPGCVGARKLASVAGWAKMGILYEYAKVEDLPTLRNRGATTEALRPPHKWTNVVKQLVHAPGSPHAARRIWPAM